MNAIPRQYFNPPLTPWHITFGTYGARLHGGERPTVDKQHNRLNEQFVWRDPEREEREQERMKFSSLYLTHKQRVFVEAQLPSICERGGWKYRICSGGPDHVHLLCDVVPEVHGEKVRRLVKRWLGQDLSGCWPLPKDATWWAEEGSNKAIGDEEYLNNCYRYIFEQRTTPPEC
ncbi:MAG TPA: hypothetical protein VHK01_11385 [Lacipirellulaceae bacterium]|nr:hypothetical protein [Lacipirellulaceae bacterium]